MLELSWLLIAIPLACAALLLTWGKESDRFGHLIATACSAASFVLGLVMFIELAGRDSGDRSVTTTLGTWIDAGRFHVDFSFTFDTLSSLFVLLITGVGTLIHVYSIGYMAHDPRRRRFFAYLNLFLAAMLMLVLSENYLGLFLGWEGVGLASYLLISFWQHKPSAAAAGKKAFVINRVGDMGLSLAIMLFFVTFGSTSFTVISAGAGDASDTTVTIPSATASSALTAPAISARTPAVTSSTRSAGPDTSATRRRAGSRGRPLGSICTTSSRPPRTTARTTTSSARIS